MAADRRAGGEQLLGHDIAFEKAALGAAVALRPGDADPAARAEAAAEPGIAMRAEIAVRGPISGREFLGDEAADLFAQRLAFGRQVDRIEPEWGRHSRTLQAAAPRGEARRAEVSNPSNLRSGLVKRKRAVPAPVSSFRKVQN